MSEVNQVIPLKVNQIPAGLIFPVGVGSFRSPAGKGWRIFSVRREQTASSCLSLRNMLTLEGRRVLQTRVTTISLHFALEHPFPAQFTEKEGKTQKANYLAKALSSVTQVTLGK